MTEQEVQRDSFFTILWRHKIVVGVTAALVLVLLAGSVATATPTYRASSSSVLLFPPAPPADAVKNGNVGAVNPWVTFNDLSIVTDVLKRILTSEPVVSDLRAQGLQGTYTVTTNADFDRGPVIEFAAEGSNQQVALNDIKLLQDEMGKQLVAMQARNGTDTAYFITTDVIVPASKATKVFSGMLRQLIVLGGLGAVFVLGSAGVAEAVSRRRRGPGIPDEEAPAREEREHLRLA